LIEQESKAANLEDPAKRHTTTPPESASLRRKGNPVANRKKNQKKPTGTERTKKAPRPAKRIANVCREEALGDA